MKTKILVYVLPALIVTTIHLVEAQQPKKVFRIGFLAAGTAGRAGPTSEALRQGLRQLGYIEGQNIIIEYMHAQSRFERLPDLAADLVRLKVDVIVTVGTPATIAVKQVTTTIPIVMVGTGDPVGNGLVASLARPRGNITGLSALTTELSGKRLELLKETFPKISRVAFFIWNPDNPANKSALKETEAAAKALGLKLQSFPYRNLGDLDEAFSTITKSNVDALTLTRGRYVSQRIIDLAAKSRLPAIYPVTEDADRGGLMAYGISDVDLHRRAATYVDKILRGAKPADLPVEQPMKFEFVVNLKTAKQLGLTIPPNVLARADKVIK